MDEYEVKAVMDRTGCDREKAVAALKWSRCRVGVAIMYIRESGNDGK